MLVVIAQAVRMEVNQHGRGDPGDWFAGFDPVLVFGGIGAVVVGGFIVFKLFLSR